MSRTRKLEAFFCLVFLFCALGLIGWAVTLTNGNNDQLTFITADRAGGAPLLTNGNGAQATIFVQWYQSTTTTNGRGEILETGAAGSVRSTGARSWSAY